MIERHLARTLRRAARTMPVVTLHGPRQSGKTTLARATFPRHAYVTLEDPSVREEAFADPRGFLRRVAKGAILDEVHRAPDLLSYLQGIVDEDARPGRFVLTSSQNLLPLRNVSQSLAGRTAILRLLPFSVAELAGWRARPLRSLFAPRKRGPAGTGEGPAKLAGPDAGGAVAARWEAIWRGFFPRVCDVGADPVAWSADYVRTYVERDVREVLRIGDLRAFQRFLVGAAARTAQELNLSDLAADAGVTHPTVGAWLSVLEASSIVALLPAYHENYGKLLRKRPKLHFLDTGLVCSLLGIRDAGVLERHPLRGAIFESFVAGEVLKTVENHGERPRVFHWRDAKGLEVDLLVDAGGSWFAVEAKSGETVAQDWFGPLMRWTDLARDLSATGVIVHGGAANHDSRGVLVRPWWGA